MSPVAPDTVLEQLRWRYATKKFDPARRIAPELWSKLERDAITIREACGNTVRNVAACYLAGVCPKEVSDVTPHVVALTERLLVDLPSKAKHVILLSDGQRTTGPDPIEAARMAAERGSSGVGAYPNG